MSSTSTTSSPSPSDYGSTGTLLFHGEPPLHDAWDYILPLPLEFPDPADWEHASFPITLSALLLRLREAGFSYLQAPSKRDLILLQLTLPPELMQENASHLHLILQLKPAYGGGYLAFHQDRAHVFVNADRTPYFSPAHRATIVLETLQSAAFGAAIDIKAMHKAGFLVAHGAFVPHVSPERDLLVHYAVWKRWWDPARPMPLAAMRDYFGARVAVYFAWLLFYARMLMGIAALSVPVYVGMQNAERIGLWLGDAYPGVGEGLGDTILNLTRLVWGVGLCFWGAYWTEYWKRRNAVLQAKWGLGDVYSDDENDIRLGFRGVNKHGFYCKGGFVDLQDLTLAPGTAENTLEEQQSDDESETIKVQCRVPTIEDTAILLHPAADATAATRGGSEEDEIEEGVEMVEVLHDEDDDDDDDDDGGIVQNVVVIGGEKDADFRLEAPVTGLLFSDLPLFPFFSKRIVRNRVWVSGFITFLFATLVAFLSFAILWYRHSMIQLAQRFGLPTSIGNAVPGVCTAVLISVSDPIWKNISEILTHWENHRTQIKFENSLIRKRFAFQFVSNYISLFYIAFVKPFTPFEQCTIDPITNRVDCMHELEVQLTSLLIARATIQQFMEVGAPFLILHIRSFVLQWRRRSDDSESLLSHHEIANSAEAQLKMDANSTAIGDYGELVIQHGFLVLFGLAFPLAALINLINNVIEGRTDAYKMLKIQKRPVVDDTAEIGSWQNAINFLSTASLITTAALVTITTPALQRALPGEFGHRAEKYPAVCFLVFEHLLLFVRWVVSRLVNDRPTSTYRLQARQQFLVARCFNEGWKPYFKSAKREEQDEEA